MSARVGAGALRDYAAAIMAAHGVDEEQIRSVADNLIWSELVGRANFGLVRLPIHLKRMRLGLIRCPCRPRARRLAPAIERLEGDDGFGHFVAETAMRRAVALARAEGIGTVGVRDSNFFGTGAYFVAIAAEAGMIGLALSNSFPKVVPHGGLKPVFGTNPLAFGAPRANGDHLLLDMATSALAGSTVREHVAKKKPLPEGLAIDGDGAPIRDARQIGSGALLPFGGPKGSGLALLVEILAGILTGAGVSHGVASLYEDFTQSGHSGHFFLALDISRWMPLDAYFDRLETLLALIKRSNPRDEVLLPGEIRWRNLRENREQGISVEDATRRALDELAAPHGIEAPWDG